MNIARLPSAALSQLELEKPGFKKQDKLAVMNFQLSHCFQHSLRILGGLLMSNEKAEV